MNPDSWPSYKNTRVLVTGSAGFIGSHLLPALCRQGADVIACVHNQESESKVSANEVTCKILDVCDVAAVNSVMDWAKPEVVFHLAARIGGEHTTESMRRQAANTFLGAVNVAAAATENNVSLMVQIGSSEEYGEGPTPFQEGQPERPLSAYSAAKAAATQFILVSNYSFQLQALVIRPMVVYGPGQRNEMLIPHLFKHFLRGEPASLTDGEQTRDFVYIDDVISALVLAGKRQDLSGQIINVGSSNEYKVKDVVAKVAEVCGYKGDLGLGARPYRMPEVMRHVASTARAKELLGWSPQVDLDEGLKRTLQWMQSSERTDG